MKLTQLLLCKTPFTPSYEHLVTGCSSQEFYNKLYNDRNNTTSIQIDKGNNLSFRTVRETDREIVFSINLNSRELPYFKPYQFNYTATYETDGSYRFWFIDSYNIDNSVMNPSVTFYCSIDYWHSYCLISTDNFITQRIGRITQNGRTLNNIFFADNLQLPHDVQIISNDRVLWGRARFNTIGYSDNYGRDVYFGTILDGSLSHAYIPLGVFSGSTFRYFNPNVTIEMGNTYKQITLNGNVASVDDKPAGSIISPTLIRYAIEGISNFATIESFDLTYLPPFEYTYDEDSITILDYCNVIILARPDVPLEEQVSLITPALDKDIFTKTIRYNISLPSPTDSTPDVYFYNRYPFRYYSIIVGEKEFTVNYPIQTVLIEITNNGSGNSSSCNLYVNGRLIADNIEISLSVPLPITTDQAGEIEAIYGSGYREIKLLTSLFNTSINAIPTPTGKKRDKLPSLPSMISSVGGGIISGYMDTYEYLTEDNIPSTVYSPTSPSSEISYGDYPIIKLYSIKPGYETIVNSFIKMKGESVDYYDNPIVRNHKYFDFITTFNTVLLTRVLNGRGNEILSSAFNRGVYLWHYDNINSISNDVGNFNVINSNR
jgi:hypothetical protein